MSIDMLRAELMSLKELVSAQSSEITLMKMQIADMQKVATCEQSDTPNLGHPNKAHVLCRLKGKDGFLEVNADDSNHFRLKRT
ncbi:Uncharacterised protein [Providencia rustigianii]|uniref:Uncharacterized protein n=2 Tax=Providencia rustigianii TaxID=158850 RepID=A0A379G4G4_9GAMM|nr:hypothetical protein [Providencia rustigianii]SUC26299.1 Uncharacterised protein [Providencia rustigianii]SUC35835.1 Uncharacterised protein [Providencia rustigianii]